MWTTFFLKGFPGDKDIRDADLIPVAGRSPGGGMATHSRILVWRIPWTEEPGRPQSMGTQRVRHSWSNLAQHCTAFLSLYWTCYNTASVFLCFGFLAIRYVGSNPHPVERQSLPLKTKEDSINYLSQLYPKALHKSAVGTKLRFCKVEFWLIENG